LIRHIRFTILNFVILASDSDSATSIIFILTYSCNFKNFFLQHTFGTESFSLDSEGVKSRDVRFLEDEKVANKQPVEVFEPAMGSNFEDENEECDVETEDETKEERYEEDATEWEESDETEENSNKRNNIYQTPERNIHTHEETIKRGPGRPRKLKTGKPGRRLNVYFTKQRTTQTKATMIQWT